MASPDLSPPDNLYAHVSALTVGVHEGLLAWARARLHDAGHETIEIYGQFPALGTTASHVVLFPFHIGPDPKLIETATPGPLMGALRSEPPPNVPRPLVDLGRLIHEALAGLVGERKIGSGHPLVASLPPPLRAWFMARSETNWVVPPSETNGGPRARLPALMWRPGLSLAIRYLAVAGEPGRGTSERTSTGAPVSLRALSVLAAAVHIERLFETNLPAQPLPADLVSFVPALAECAGDEFSGRLSAILDRVRAPVFSGVAIHPAGEMSDQALTSLMQGLQRPFQATLTLQVRMSVAGFPAFEPSASPQINTRPAPR